MFLATNTRLCNFPARFYIKIANTVITPNWPRIAQKRDINYNPVIKSTSVTPTARRPDRKDMDIISALDRLGPKVSTEEVSDIVGIPARTVRYRIQRMRETGVLCPTRVMALERRMGLGESIFVVNATSAGYQYLPNIFYKIDTIYHYSSTYGRYNGFLAYSLYSLSTPRIVRRILEECQKYDLITDFFTVDVHDYDVKRADYTRYDAESGWNWDWDDWESQITKNNRSKMKRKFKPPLNADQTIVDFDFTDVSILKLMFDDGEITQKNLAEKLSLSETQVNKRIRQLEERGIIKGYRFAVSESDEFLPLFCFFELESPVSPVISNIYQLPFPATIMMESKTRYAMTMSLSAKDTKGFLKGFDILRPHLSSYFIQTVHDSQRSMDSHPYDLFNLESNGWRTPGDEYIQDIHDVLAGKK
ncbi:MAG: winged helix-turn-helix transcriptional regulator [Promethearchaeota archaeon]